EALQRLPLGALVPEVPVGLAGAPEGLSAKPSTVQIAIRVGDGEEAARGALPGVALPVEVRHVPVVRGETLAAHVDEIARPGDVLALRIADDEALEGIERGADRGLVLLVRGRQQPGIGRLVLVEGEADAVRGEVGPRMRRVAL